jgi:hypothetical protein
LLTVARAPAPRRAYLAAAFRIDLALETSRAAPHALQAYNSTANSRGRL